MKRAVIVLLCVAAVVLAAGKQVVEKETGTKFAAELKGAAGGKRMVCIGTACREKTMFAVNVYAVAHWIEVEGAKKALAKWKGKTGKALEKDQAFFNALCKADVEKRLRLVFVRDVESKKIREAFGDSLKNTFKPLPKTVKDFIALWKVDLKEGNTMELRSLPGGTLEAYQNGKLLKKFEKDKELASGVWLIWFQSKLADGYLEDVKTGLVSGVGAIWK